MKKLIALILILISGYLFISGCSEPEMWQDTDVLATMDKTITQRGDTLFLNVPKGYFSEFQWYYNSPRQRITTEYTEYVLWKWEKREVICKLLDENDKGCWSSPHKVK